MTAKEHNEFYNFFHDITGEAMLVHREYHEGLLESAYEAALTYLLKAKGYTVEKQVYLPMFWKDVKLEQHMNFTRVPFGMLMNFGAKQFYSEWYHRHKDGTIEKIHWRDEIIEMLDERWSKSVDNNI